MRMPAAHLAATPCAILIAAVFSLASLPLRAAATPAVQWRELRVPRRTLHSMVWDSRRQRVLMFGGDGNQDAANPLPGVWQLVTGADPHWKPFTVAGDGPPPRSGMCAVYDSLRDRVLAFGGREAYGGPASNDLWQLSLAGEPAWSLLDASAGATPPPRWSATMVLDAQDRLVLYGGDGNAVYDPDVYLLPLGALPLAWQDLALAGPGPRARHGAVFSPITHRMTVFGGDLVTGFDAVPRPAETWELVLDDPIHWVKRASARPAARSSPIERATSPGCSPATRTSPAKSTMRRYGSSTSYRPPGRACRAARAAPTRGRAWHRRSCPRPARCSCTAGTSRSPPSD